MKYAWMDEADVSLIAYSCASLKNYLGQHPGLRVRMNYPGVGNGGLTYAQVEPVLSGIKDMVTICRR